MEKYAVFMDWKNQYSENEYTTQSNQCNSYQATNGIFQKTRTLSRRRQWHPTPVLLSGESQGWWSLVGCHLWGRIELDTTEATAAGAAAVYFRYQSFINFFFFTKIFSKSMACLFILLRGLSCPTPHKLRVCLG